MTGNQGGNGRALAPRPALEPDNVGRSLLSQLSPAQRQILKNRICIGAPDADCELFLIQAETEGLNPWAMPPEAWLIARRQKVNEQWLTQFIPQKSKDGALKAAKVRGVYLGHQHWHMVGGEWYPDGDEPEAEHPERTRCWITSPGYVAKAVVRWNERAQYTRDGQLTDFWKRMPFEMLAKCALVAALKLLPLNSEMEIADEEYDDVGVSRRAFWAWADERKLDEPAVRRALNVEAQKSLAAHIESIGGWNAARAHVEDRAAAASGERQVMGLRAGDNRESFGSVARGAGLSEAEALNAIATAVLDESGWPAATLALRGHLAKVAHSAAVSASMPEAARGGTASDLLWTPDEEDPIVRAAQQQQASPTAAEARTALRLDPAEANVALDPGEGETRAIFCAECGAPATYPGDDAGCGPRCEVHRAPPTAGDPELCNVCGQSPPAGMTPDGVLACQECINAAPSSTAPPPELDGTVRSFIDALRLHGSEGGMPEVDARARISRLGRVSWGGLSAEEIARRWQVVS